MSYDDNNVFAKILRGEIPSHKVYEDADALVFMDVMPQAPGAHAGRAQGAVAQPARCRPGGAGACMAPLVQKVARAVKEAFDADGVTRLQFNEPAGGQTVFHLHFHVIPRHEGVPLDARTPARWRSPRCSPATPRRSAMPSRTEPTHGALLRAASLAPQRSIGSAVVDQRSLVTVTTYRRQSGAAPGTKRTWNSACSGRR